MIKILDKIWRFHATAISFATFGIGGIFLGVILLPIIYILPLDKRYKVKTTRKIISTGFRMFMFLMHYLGALKFHRKNIESLKNDKNCIIISNHPTLIDVVSIISYTPNACCIVKEGVWNNFFYGFVVKLAGYIPNTNNHELIQKAIKSINNNEVLVIFPEGTRTTPGEPLKFQRGVAHLILAAKCKLRPIKIECYPNPLLKTSKWYNIPYKRVDFSIEVLDQIEPIDEEILKLNRPLAVRKITKNLIDFYETTLLQKKFS